MGVPGGAHARARGEHSASRPCAYRHGASRHGASRHRALRPEQLQCDSGPVQLLFEGASRLVALASREQVAAAGQAQRVRLAVGAARKAKAQADVQAEVQALEEAGAQHDGKLERAKGRQAHLEQLQGLRTALSQQVARTASMVTLRCDQAMPREQVGLG